MFRKMRGFGDPLQLSVFQCDLSAAERVLMIEALSQIINHCDDQVMLIKIGPAENRGQQSIETLAARFLQIPESEFPPSSDGAKPIASASPMTKRQALLAVLNINEINPITQNPKWP